MPRLRIGPRAQPQYVLTTALKGVALCQEPLLNKGAAFSPSERAAFELDGLVPPGTQSIDHQARHFYDYLATLPDMIERYVELRALQDTNEHLFYRVLTEHLEELIPIVYTPTVGEAIQRFSSLYRRGRGIWLSPGCRGRMRAILQRRTAAGEVRLIVATDSGSILGLGDQGAGGMAIAVGKLAIYCAAARLHPAHTLPVCLDVGTDNPALLADPDYLGWRAPRLRGPEYLSFVDEFIDAVTAIWPEAVLQWEDFRNETAAAILERSRDRLPTFNDDIQGTGAMVVAGLLAAERHGGVPLTGQRVVVFGAGAAGLGITRQIRDALVRLGVQPDEAGRRIAALDSRGLIGHGAAGHAAYKNELAMSEDELARFGLAQGSDLAAVVARFRATVLIGTSGAAGAFTEEIIRALGENARAPVVMALSNPTQLTEAVPADVVRWSDGRALIATGSPFEAVQWNGRRHTVGQGNNAFVFPGIGLGTVACRASRITDNMLWAASKAIARAVATQDSASGTLYPTVAQLPEVTRAVAEAVAEAAVLDGVARTPAWQDALTRLRWDADYPQLALAP